MVEERRYLGRHKLFTGVEFPLLGPEVMRREA